MTEVATIEAPSEPVSLSETPVATGSTQLARPSSPALPTSVPPSESLEESASARAGDAPSTNLPAIEPQSSVHTSQHQEGGVAEASTALPKNSPKLAHIAEPYAPEALAPIETSGEPKSEVRLEFAVEDRTPTKPDVSALANDSADNVAVEDQPPSKAEPLPVQSTPPPPAERPSLRREPPPPPLPSRDDVPPQPQSSHLADPQQKKHDNQPQLPRPTPSWQTAPRAAQQGRRGPPPPVQAQSPVRTGPLPRNLPKNAKHRPRNARVFVGNLASEFTDSQEMVSIFHKYGELIEEPVLRRSFGFIQYSTAEAASRAVAAEQGRVIGGIGIDLSIADNREVKRGTHVVNNTPFPHGPKQKIPPNNPRGGRGRDSSAMQGGAQPPSRKRRRSLSPGPPRRIGIVNPPTFHRMRPEPRTGFHLRVLCMSPTARMYAKRCEQMFRAEVGLGVEVSQIIASSLGDALAKAMRDVIPYVMVVASKDVEDGTCTIRTLEKTGYEKAGRGNGVISLREAIDVCLIDRGIRRPPLAGQPSFHAQSQMPVAQAGWTAPGPMGAGPRPPAAARQPGWMSGARAPVTTPQQQPLRQGVPPQAGVPPHMPNVASQHQSYPPGQPQMLQHQMGQMQGRPDNRGQYDRQSQYSGMPAHGGMAAQPPVPEYGAPPPQMGWNAGNQQPPVSRFAQPPAVQHEYGRGPYGAPPQGAMGGSSGPGPNGRDEYDPAAVMPGNGRSGGYNGWNGMQQPTSYNRQSDQYDMSRPGPGSAPALGSVPHGRDQVPSSYGMGNMQGPYNPNMGPYGSVPGNDQGYPQRPGAYGPSLGRSAPPGGRYGPGGPGPGGFEGRGNWGSGNGIPFDPRGAPHHPVPGRVPDDQSQGLQQGPDRMPSDPQRHQQGYSNGGGNMGRRDGPEYTAPRNAPGAAEWGGRRNQNNSRRDNVNGGPGGDGHGFNGGPRGGHNGRSGMNGAGNGDGNGTTAGAAGVDIGKLSSLISAFQQQQQSVQGGSGPARGGGRNGGPSSHAGHTNSQSTGPGHSEQGVPPGVQNGGHMQHGQQYYGQYGGPLPQQGMYQQPPPGQHQRGYYGR